jgi:hypothetical protein
MSERLHFMEIPVVDFEILHHRVKVAEAQLARCREAADRYVNWHLPRIRPTEDCPTQEDALLQLVAALAESGEGT